MKPFDPETQILIRSRFAHVADCPFQGPRIFFENAGGALTLNSVVETSAKFAALPDNQGRDNPAAHALVGLIRQAKADMATFFGTQEGQFFVGESGTELTFRLIRTAVMGNAKKGKVLGSSVEHPASRSAAQHWAKMGRMDYVNVPHDNASGAVSPQAYADLVTSDVKVATILHTSPVTGIANDVTGIAQAIRAVAPEAFIIVDGIQHACHGRIDIARYDVDGYVISPYKVFSRHGYGIAWVSDRMTALPIETLRNGPACNWELGTRDTGAYATFSDVVGYFDWLGRQFTETEDPRARIEDAGSAIHAHEHILCQTLLHGADNLAGLCDLPGVTILGGAENLHREGLVCFALDGIPAGDIVATLNGEGIRTHIRKADHYSGNILKPLNLESAVRVSFCHYNTVDEVKALLGVLKSMTERST